MLPSLLSCLFFVLEFEKLDSFSIRCEPVVALDPTPVVKIPNFGVFSGSATVSLKKQRIIYQYLGIPYALPPMGLLRFKSPVPIKSLNLDHVYSAENFKQKCPQIVTDEDAIYLQNNWEKAEDCLYLNIFTVTNAGENHQPLLPVLIYIHGGGFYQGSSSENCPNYLLDNDMILVTLNYRLGPLGFLNLDDDEAAGNMGLLDILEAIKWVNKFIKYFGGDNRRVTISGQSSGANAVSLMLVSSVVTPGLFQQAIIQSGNFLGDWAIDRNSVEHGFQFAEYVNCSSQSTEEVIQCLRNVSSATLVKANLQYLVDRVNATQNIVKEVGINHAVIQTSGTIKFLDQDPVQILKLGKYLKVPIITGVTKDEGSIILDFLVDFVLQRAYERLHLTSKNESVYLKNEFFYDFIKFNGITENIHLVELVKNYYLPNEMCIDFNHTVPGLVDLSGALIFKSVALKFARYMYQSVPIYLYTFNYKGRKTKLGYGKKVKYVLFNGVAHSDELIYLFPKNDDPSLNKEEKKVVEYLTELNLLSSSDLPKWPPMSTVVGPYLQIGKKLRVRDNFLNEYRNYLIYKEPEIADDCLKMGF